MPILPRSDTYHLPEPNRQILEPLSRYSGVFNLQQLENNTLNPEQTQAFQALLKRQRLLIDNARTFFTEQAVPAPRTIPDDLLTTEPVTFSDMLTRLFARHRGIALGIRPPRVAALRLLIGLLPQLHTIKTLYVTGLLADFHQEDLDRYHTDAGAVMPASLHEYVVTYDKLRHYPPDASLLRLLETARGQNIRLVALENAVTRAIHPGQPLDSRTGVEIVNYFAYLRITEGQQQSNNGPWLAWMDETQLNRFEEVLGVMELTDGIGVRVSLAHDVYNTQALKLYLRADRGEEVVTPAGERYWVKSDLLLCADPLIDISMLKIRLDQANTFAMLARPDTGEFELRYRAPDQSIVMLPILRDALSQNRFFIDLSHAPENWGNIPQRRYLSIQVLAHSLQQDLGMKNAWPDLAPVVDTPASQLSASRRTGWLHQPSPAYPQVTVNHPPPPSRAYELPLDDIEQLIAQQDSPHGLDIRYARHDLPLLGRLARDRFIRKREQLLTDAEQYYKQTQLPQRATLPDLKLDTPLGALIDQLLTRYPGIVVGEIHAERWGKQLLIEQMALLQNQGVRTLYVEQLLTEQHQVWLDKWNTAPSAPIPASLQRDLSEIDLQHQTPPDHSFIALIKAAHQHGIAIVTIDCFCGQPVKGAPNEFQRLKIMNYYAALRISERQNQVKNAKWVALVGNGHTNQLGQVPGIAELTGAAGLRVAGEPLGLLPDTGIWAESVEWGQCFLKADLIATHRPILSDSDINARLQRAGDFVIVYVPEPTQEAFELRYRDGQNIVVLPIRRTEDSTHYYLTDTPWAKINHQLFTSIKLLRKTVQVTAQQRNVWHNLTPQPLSTLPAAQRESMLHPAHVEQQRREAFECQRQATLLRMVFFATASERADFKAGKTHWQVELEKPPLLLSNAPLATLKQTFVQQVNTLSCKQQGALLAAIGERQAQHAEQEAERWHTKITTLGAEHFRMIAHNRYLSSTDHSHGLCAGIITHMAAGWLQDAATPGHAFLDSYLDDLAASTNEPDSAHARILDLALVAWSFGAPEDKFHHNAPSYTLSKAGVLEILQQAPKPAVFELSLGSHAILLAKGSTYLLADPNFGYCKIPHQQALERILDWHGNLVTRLFSLNAEAAPSFRLRRYRADLARQKLFPFAEAGRFGSLMLADLSSLQAMSTRFNTPPLAQDPHFLRLARRLTLVEYRHRLNHTQFKPFSYLLSDLLTRHQAPQSAVQTRAKVLKITFHDNNACVTLAARAGQVYSPVWIDGIRHPQDIALLRQLSTLKQQVDESVRSPFFSRLFRRRALSLEVDREVLASALPDTLPEEVMNLLQGAGNEVRATTPELPSIVADFALRLSHSQQQAAQIAQRLDHSIGSLLAAEPHPENLIPLFHTLQPDAKGGMRLQVANWKDPEAQPIQFVSLDTDKTLAEMQALMEKSRLQIKQTTQAMDQQGRNSETPLAGEDLVVDGLNAAFLVQTIQRLLARKETSSEGSIGKNLAIALQLHDYANMLMIAAGSTQDVLHGAELVRTLRALAVGETLPGASAGLLGKGMALLQLVSVGLDIYELTQAQTENQRVLFGTNLFFDLAGLATLAASTVGAPVVGTLAAIIVGIGIVVLGIENAFLAVANNAARVGQYFANLRRVYHTSSDTLGAGYEYDSTHKSLSPAYPAVVVKLDLRQQQATLLSPLLYPSKHGSTGSGRIHYFFWVGDMPRMQHDRSRAINLCQRLQYTLPTALPPAGRTARKVILPNVPQHYLSYSYNFLPGATTRKDGGFDVLRQLEGDDFDFDFYIFPSEYLIDQLHFEYVATPIEVLLDEGDYQLIMPPLPESIWGCLDYTVRALRGQTYIGLARGASLTLTTEHASQCEWILDARQLDYDNVYTFSGNQINIGGVIITIAYTTDAPTIMLLRKNNIIEQLNVAEARHEVVEIDAARWSSTQLNQYLQKLKTDHPAQSHVVRVKDYALPGQSGKKVSYAYYDNDNARMLYVSEEQGYPNCTLALIDGDKVYFYNQHHNKVLRIHPQTCTIEAEFSLRNSPEIQVWRERGRVLLSQVSHQPQKQPSAIFSLENDALILRHATADAALLNRLKSQERLTDMRVALNKIMAKHYVLQRPSKTSEALIPLNDFVILDDVSQDTLHQRYWLRTHDGALISARLPKDEPQTQRENLLLAHIDTLPNGKEVIFFYHVTFKRLYRQIGYGVNSAEGAQKLDIPGLVSVSKLNGQLYAQTEQGLVELVDQQGKLTHTAVSRDWFKARPNWPKALIALAGDTTLSVLDLKRADDSVQPAWIMAQRLVLASSNLPLDAQLIGMSREAREAWLFNAHDGYLYRQPLLTSQEITQAFGQGTKLIGNPVARAEPRQQFASLALQGTALAVELLDGYLPPPMSNITQLLLVPTVMMGYLGISQDDWRAYLRLAIDLGRLPQPKEDQAGMLIELKLSNPMALHATRENDDLLILDRATGKSLLVYQVFTETNQRKVTIRIRDAVSGKPLTDGIHETLAQADHEIWSMWTAPPKCASPREALTPGKLSCNEEANCR